VELAHDARGGDPADQELRATLAGDIQRWLARPAAAASPPQAAPGAPSEPPPGPPIGGWGAADECEWGVRR
jgi:hypothetical protein